MNVQERILNSQLLMAMEKYPDLSKDLGLIDMSIEMEDKEMKERTKTMTRDSPKKEIVTAKIGC